LRECRLLVKLRWETKTWTQEKEWNHDFWSPAAFRCQVPLFPCWSPAAFRCQVPLFPCWSPPAFRCQVLGPAPTATGTIAFWKFYLTRTGFTTGESVSLVKVFWLFRLDWTFLGVWSANMGDRCPTSYLLAGPVCLVNIQIFRITSMLVGGMNDPSFKYCKLTL
jgi:hypothetical protein